VRAGGDRREHGGAPIRALGKRRYEANEAAAPATRPVDDHPKQVHRVPSISSRQLDLLARCYILDGRVNIYSFGDSRSAPEHAA
jgi:hypothetical protein